MGSCGENLRDWNLWIWEIKKKEEKKSHVWNFLKNEGKTNGERETHILKKKYETGREDLTVSVVGRKAALEGREAGSPSWVLQVVAAAVILAVTVEQQIENIWSLPFMYFVNTDELHVCLVISYFFKLARTSNKYFSLIYYLFLYRYFRKVDVYIEHHQYIYLLSTFPFIRDRILVSSLS